jgi:enoyl-CoA hydratase/carnithine racemase
MALMRPASTRRSDRIPPIRAPRTTKAGVTDGHDTLPAVTDLLNVSQAVELLEALHAGRRGIDGPLAAPVVVVDVDGGRRVADLQPPAGWSGVLIAVSRATSARSAPVGPDILISAADNPPRPWVQGTDEAVEVIQAAVAAHPQAATVLVQVLRAGSTLGTAAALTLESLAYSTLQAGPEHHSWLDTRRVRTPDHRDDPVVRLERRADRLEITLDRPERRNAYSARMRDELVAALEMPAFDDSITSVDIRGAGRDFCSGGDLAEFGTLSDPATAHSIRMHRSAGWGISQIADRVTVHLHGACIGAGIELAAFAGAVESTADATMALPEVGMGLIPGAGGTASLPRRIGPARTAWLALTGTRLDALTARRWGLVDRVVPVDAVPAGPPDRAPRRV